MPSAPGHSQASARWGAALAFGGLFSAALLLFFLARLLDGGGLEGLRDPVGYLSRLDHDVAMDRVSNAAEVVAGVLAILITVVAIVVELAANRYTHRITQLFVRDPVNLVVMGLFVLTTILCLWVSTTPAPTGEAPLPRGALVLCMSLVTACLLALIPYFGFLFRFVSPLSILDRLRIQAVRAVGRARTRPVEPERNRVVEAIEELEDVARSARDHSDRGISMAGVDALAELVREVAPLREGLPRAWFAVDAGLARDPDFVSMAPSVLDEIDREGTWLEIKVLRQYWSLFSESLVTARDVANLVALNTRRLTEEGALPLRLSCQFFNSYLRAAINARDLRTAYYVLHQYRLLAEFRLVREDGADTLEIASHLRYYGRLGYEQNQAFLLEVVAYDIGLLVERAARAELPDVDPLLDMLLEVDSESRTFEQEERLRGVRRAQIQVAAFFLERGDEARARRVYEDMAGEPPERMVAIRAELEAEKESGYREFTDRGVNFAYLEPARRAKLPEFFGWFEGLGATRSGRPG